MTVPLRYVTFNVWQGQSPRSLVSNLDRLADDLEAPHIIALQEAWKLERSIPGYQRIACEHMRHHRRGDGGIVEALSTQLLVRRDGVQITDHGCVHVDGPQWRGPKHGHAHDPRTYPWAVIDVDPGQHMQPRAALLGAHRTPGGPNSRIRVNRESWAAEDRALVEWMERRQRRHPSQSRTIAADWNDRLDDGDGKPDRAPLGVAALARHVDARAHLRGIDGFLVANARRVRAHRVDGTYGSDAHRPVAARITPNPFRQETAS